MNEFTLIEEIQEDKIFVYEFEETGELYEVLKIINPKAIKLSSKLIWKPDKTI